MSRNQPIKDQKQKEYLALFEERKKKFSIPPPSNQIIYEDEEFPRSEEKKNPSVNPIGWLLHHVSIFSAKVGGWMNREESTENQSTKDQICKEYPALFEERKKKFSIPPPPNQIIYEDEEFPRYRG